MLRKEITYFQVNHPYYETSMFLYKGESYNKNTIYTVFIDYKDYQRVLASFKQWFKFYTFKDYLVIRCKGWNLPSLLSLLKHNYEISDCKRF